MPEAANALMKRDFEEEKLRSRGIVFYNRGRSITCLILDFHILDVCI